MLVKLSFKLLPHHGSCLSDLDSGPVEEAILVRVMDGQDMHSLMIITSNREPSRSIFVPNV